uniref:Uncharacterized protein n=1 Tax=viral metagenome TaxID=1070528 RepID=A0A6C0HLE6_9ZZZZ
MTNQTKTLLHFIDTNNSSGLNKALKKNKHEQAALQEVLNYAALMGDDQSIRVLFMNGANATTEAYANAFKTTATQGHGGHTLAAVYIKSIKNKLIDPSIPLSKLNLTISYKNTKNTKTI